MAIDGMSTGVYLYENSNHYTHFTGFMLEEEIVASLWEFLPLLSEMWKKYERPLTNGANGSKTNFVIENRKKYKRI